MDGSCKHFISLSLAWLAFFCLCFTFVSAELQRFQQPAKADGSLGFLVIGDWGRKGAYNQSEVALQMGKVGEKLSIDFVASTGDNFYDKGLSSPCDPDFKDSFTEIYTANSLQKQWYSVLGNHDYMGNVRAQLSPILRRIDSRWLCRRSFIVNTEIAELFFIDTTPFVDEYFRNPKHQKFDWRGVIPRKKYLRRVLKDVESALRESVANWKIVIGHHPIRSMGHHGETKELIMQLLPVLEANNVDMYINGHDHCLEHISSITSPLQFLTSGGGSKAWKGDFHYLDRDEMKFYYDGQGFMSVELTQTNARIVFHDVLGKVLHSLDLSKQLYTAM
ncbi:purple acid phosphatase 3-like isoform X1 [Herrania umbratica]|uniref:Purple acid phosphatase n=2 Tax=Herrania umbratica TaxID=108875 RepID=A0A6J1AZ09_9ROSI|nr:purple acid phosphatase 3-like isoform X1 [Herrania umbratica]